MSTSTDVSYLLDPDVLVQPGWSRAAVPRPVPVQFSYLLDPDVLVQPGWAGAAVPQPVPQRLVAPSQV